MLPNYYHVYNRGAHKAPIFMDKGDYDRFLYLLYMRNNTARCKIPNLPAENIFTLGRQERLVDIVAYCLMPNHFHIIIKTDVVDGIERFIHKLCTSYSMYYNKKYDHSGTLFQGRYQAKHIDTDEYLRYVIQYVHLNPFGIIHPDMDRRVKNEFLIEATTYSRNYEYSSFKDYLGENRPQRSILGPA